MKVYNFVKNSIAMAQNEKEAIEQRIHKEEHIMQVIESNDTEEPQEQQEEVHKKGRKKKNQKVV